LCIAAAFPAIICNVYLIRGCMHCNENPIYVFLFWELRGLSPNFHIQVSVSNLYISRIGPHIFLQQVDQSWKHIKLSQINECRKWETEHYNSVLEITVSFLGIHKWEPDIYIDSHRPFICSVLYNWAWSSSIKFILDRHKCSSKISVIGSECFYKRF
jgi:hypothetical protein